MNNRIDELEPQLAEAKAAYQDALNKMRAVPKGKQYLNAYLAALAKVSDTYGEICHLEKELLKHDAFYS